jgi:hypothetical protein
LVCFLVFCLACFLGSSKSRRRMMNIVYCDWEILYEKEGESVCASSFQENKMKCVWNGLVTSMTQFSLHSCWYSVEIFHV